MVLAYMEYKGAKDFVVKGVFIVTKLFNIAAIGVKNLFNVIRYSLSLKRDLVY